MIFATVGMTFWSCHVIDLYKIFKQALIFVAGDDSLKAAGADWVD
jgi:hypothetical protein